LFTLVLSVTSAPAETLKAVINASHQYLPSFEPSTAYLRVDLEGIRPRGVNRAPLNLALVIDRSGSMSGQKIEDAKNAAIYVIRQLQAEDIVSVVTYSDSVEVMIPATKVSDRNVLIQRIRQIQSNGNTALFAGVSKGAAEVRKFLSNQRINRVILLSDGLANVGPSSPQELAQLGRSLSRETISVSTLGIGQGYNEDLMTKLAYNSDGNHVFVAQSSELADIFTQELNELFGATAKDICIRIHVSDAFRIVRWLGREGEIRGNSATITLNQVSDRQEKYVMLELSQDPSVSANDVLYATAEVDFLDPFKAGRVQEQLRFDFNRTHDSHKIELGLNKDVIADATMQIATLNSEKAVTLRDEGKLKEAEETFRQNAEYLIQAQKDYDLPALEPAVSGNFADAESVYDEAEWESKRKQLREEQATVRTSQAVGSSDNRYLKPNTNSSPSTKQDSDSKSKSNN
ncbi:MAG: VWA domain-containing protein, partial [Verrucomicrobiae bacterium]|nr:VWA domain-containing protein [Verrucomicrobiae bacterium]